jgi:hypothetical protein
MAASRGVCDTLLPLVLSMASFVIEVHACRAVCSTDAHSQVPRTSSCTICTCAA